MSFFGKRLFCVTALSFFAVFAFHGVVLWMAPFESRYSEVAPMFYVFGFFGVLFLSAWGVVYCWARWNSLRGRSFETVVIEAQDGLPAIRLGPWLIGLSLLAVIFHFSAKLYLFTTHPVACLTDFRTLWMTLDRSGFPLIVKISSVLGHLLSSFIYFSIFISSFFLGSSACSGCQGKKYFLYQAAFFVLAAIYSLVILSKNAMLAFFLCSILGVFVSFSVRRISAWNFGLFLNRFIKPIVLPLVAFFVFSLVSFEANFYCGRPQALVNSGVSQAELTAHNNSGYYADFDLKLKNHGEAPGWRDYLFVEKCTVCAPAMVYVNHGFYNFSKIYATEQRGKPVFFEFFKSVPVRLGITSKRPEDNLERVYGPGGLTLVGAAYHDFGAPGVLLAALMGGLLLGFSIALLDSPGVFSALGLWLFSGVFYLIFVSMMFVGFNVLPFPFLSFGFLGSLSFIYFVRGRFSFSCVEL